MEKTKKFKSQKTHGFLIGLVIGTTFIAIMIFLINTALTSDEQLLKMLFYMPLVLFVFIYLYFLSGSIYCSYDISDKALTIKHGLEYKTIKYTDLEKILILRGEPIYYPIVGISWPGYMAGLFLLAGVGSVRMYAPKLRDGVVLLKTKQENIVILPEKEEMIEVLAQAGNIYPEILELDKIQEEHHKQNINNDRLFKSVKLLNLVFLLGFFLYLIVYLPGASRKLLLLFMLSLLFVWANLGNSKRIYPYSRQAACIFGVLSILITSMFWFISIWKIHF